MQANGNPDQWQNGYPNEEVVRRDIADGNGYAVEQDGKVCGVFAFILGEDPTYGKIDGQWLNNAPYGTIHRIASDHTGKGVLRSCLAYCSAICGNIRIDTHEDNAVMHELLHRYGFTRCGTIYKADGTKRIAYQKKY